jgi:hypothetical protein
MGKDQVMLKRGLIGTSQEADSSSVGLIEGHYVVCSYRLQPAQTFLVERAIAGDPSSGVRIV